MEVKKKKDSFARKRKLFFDETLRYNDKPCLSKQKLSNLKKMTLLASFGIVKRSYLNHASHVKVAKL